MIFKVIYQTILKPKKLINSEICNKYNLLGMYSLIFVLFLVISAINIKMDFYNEIKDSMGIHMMWAFTIIIFIQTQLLSIALYIINRIYKGEFLKFSIINRYIFPFYGVYSIVKNIIILLLISLSIYNSIVGTIIGFCFRGLMCYPIYLLFNKYKISSKKIFFIMFMYIVITVTNFI